MWITRWASDASVDIRCRLGFRFELVAGVLWGTASYMRSAFPSLGTWPAAVETVPGIIHHRTNDMFQSPERIHAPLVRSLIPAFARQAKVPLFHRRGLRDGMNG